MIRCSVSRYIGLYYFMLYKYKPFCTRPSDNNDRNKDRISRCLRDIGTYLMCVLQCYIIVVRGLQVVAKRKAVIRFFFSFHAVHAKNTVNYNVRPYVYNILYYYILFCWSDFFFYSPDKNRGRRIIIIAVHTFADQTLRYINNANKSIYTG